MGYIYHIYSIKEPKTIYIGQSSNDETHSVRTGDSVAGNRVLQHFSGLYDNRHENAEFTAWLKRNRLSWIVVEIYEDKNNYGLGLNTFKKFFNIWSPKNQKIQTEFKWISSNIKLDLQKNFKKKEIEYLDSYLLDAAEILHIYYYQKRGYRLLNTQMGGSTYWISNGVNGKRILNREMTVTDLMNMINTDPAVVESLQKSFTHTWKTYWNSKKIKDEIKPQLTKLFLECLTRANGDKKGFQKEITSKETEQKIFEIIGETIWKHLPVIQNTMQHKVNGYTVELNDLSKGLYSKQINFKKLAEKYNVVQLIIKSLKSKQLIKLFENFLTHWKNAKEIEKYISSAIENAFSSVTDELIKIIENFNVSFANFFKVTCFGKSNLPINDLLNNDSYKILKINKKISENYAKSLKHISYSYFAKIANSVISGNSLDFTGRVYDFNDQYYGRVVSYPSLSFSIENILRGKADIFEDDGFTYHYIRQFLTIFARLRGTPYIGGFPTMFKSDNDGWFGLYDLPLTKLGSISSYALGPIYPAIPFISETAEEIKRWGARTISQAEYY